MLLEFGKPSEVKIETEVRFNRVICILVPLQVLAFR